MSIQVKSLQASNYINRATDGVDAGRGVGDVLPEAMTQSAFKLEDLKMCIN